MDEGREAVQQETAEVGTILRVGAALLAVVAVSALAVWLLLGRFFGERPPLVSAVPALPAPQLQSDPAADLRRYREEKRARLESYGWIDQERGVVHIPIERAMELAASGQGEGRGTNRAR